MIGLASQVFDLNGAVVLKRTEESDVATVERRMSRTATLDGGAVITDGGYSPGDKTLRIIAENVSRDEFDAVAYLVKTYSQVVVSTETGCYVGGLERLSISDGKLQVTVLVTEDIS